MTEYDFSPEAYDRYIRTQQRIAQWVDNTEAHRPQFGMNAHHLVDSSLLHPPPPMGPGHRPTRSMHDVPPYHRRQSSSSTSSSSDDVAPYSSGNQPHPPIVPGLHPMYQPQPQQPIRPPMRRRSSSTQHHPSHPHKHHRSHIQTYVVSPPPNTPAPQYGYAYNVNTGNIVSPGPYGFTSGKGSGTYVSPYPSAATTPYTQPTTYYNPNQSSYPFSQPPYQNPKSAPPASSFSIYATQPNTNPPSYAMPQQQQQQYPHTAAYPPTIYPISTGGVGPPVYPSPPTLTQRIDPKPLFYQRIFSKGKSKGSSRKSN